MHRDHDHDRDHDHSMTSPSTDRLARLEAFAERVFARPAFTMPAFLDNRSGVPQVARLTISTGAIDVLTEGSERVMTLQASAAANTIVYGRDVDGNENQQLWRIAHVGTHPEAPVRFTQDDGAMFDQGAISSSGQYVYARVNSRDKAIFDVERISVASGERQTLIQNSWETGSPSVIAVRADDGQAMVASLNGNIDADLLRVDIGPAGDIAVTNILPHEGSTEAWIPGMAYSPNGDVLWLATNIGREFPALYRVDPASGERTLFLEDAWGIEKVSPSPDGKWLAIEINTDAASRLVLVDAQDAAHRIEIAAPWGVADRFTWSPDSLRVAFGFSTPNAPSAILAANLEGRVETLARAEEPDAPAAVVPELVHYPTFDGREIPALWYRPSTPGPWPVIIDIHGGPEGQRRPEFQPIIQYYVGLGFAVLSPNVRGSTGYGTTYLHLDDIEKRLDSVADIPPAADWIARQPNLLPIKPIVFGQSYGGYMTLASLAFHPDRWSAGFDVVGMASLVTFMERTSAYRRRHRGAEYGTLEHHRDVLERVSPLSRVGDIAAPLFIIHGRTDPRVPLYESEQIYDTLKGRGQDVELRIYDDEGHGLSKRKNRVTGYAAAADFLISRVVDVDPHR